MKNDLTTDDLAARLAAAEEENRGLKGSVDHWRVKAQCYGNMVHGCSPALEEAGFPVDSYGADGAVGGVARAVRALAAARFAAEARAEKAERELAAERDAHATTKVDRNSYLAGYERAEAALASERAARVAAEAELADEQRQRGEALTKICAEFNVTSALQLAALAEREDETTIDLVCKLIRRQVEARVAAERERDEARAGWQRSIRTSERAEALLSVKEAALTAALDRQLAAESRLSRAVEALRFYGQKINHTDGSVMADAGDRARAVLAEVGK